ncbi:MULTISPECIES: cysteine-rich CWC family protein [Bacteroides]|jgi:hypothetical protein|nr:MULTISPECIES: cysteine-rich CWC family protein [Bacteroides]MCS2422746.1 cysteine-rich CWC family protein [Bacteroides fragilis]MCS2614637.1 cysteine-rich CWC family protein [Bacteroides fragilis]MCS2661106.1 cysteine-rich CWC family protein [Bacteroides fragilis]MCS2689637.1 cysteine-rich CWC family protein [Bacteroides fragilis]MCS2779549.1 cysteine-rich CWC family protein [Bacteroides fragilis]
MPMKKVCPRCGAAFECRHDNIRLCHCASVKLDAFQYAYIKENYTDCLCHSCLEDIAHSVKDDTSSGKLSIERI